MSMPENGFTPGGSVLKRNWSDQPLSVSKPDPAVTRAGSCSAGVDAKARSFNEALIEQASSKRSKPDAAAPNGESFILRTDSCDGWLVPESHHHSGLVCQRSLPIHPYQPWVARVGAHRGFGFYETMEAKDVDLLGVRQEELLRRLKATAEGLLANAEAGASRALPPEDAKLPADLAAQISSDVCSIGVAAAALCPGSPLMQIKLEIIGENICARWHRDSYVARSIVSYTGVAGTLYTPDWNVNEDALRNRGGNADIILDGREVHSVGVGDIFFMKGTGYPSGPKGIVHKAPEKSYHEDGGIVYRLALKVDIPLERTPEQPVPIPAMPAAILVEPEQGHGHGDMHAHGHAHDGEPCSGHGHGDGHAQGHGHDAAKDGQPEWASEWASQLDAQVSCGDGCCGHGEHSGGHGDGGHSHGHGHGAK